MDDKLGTIAAGKYADLLVVDGDPAADIRVLADPKNIKVIMKDGQFHKDELAGSATECGRTKAGSERLKWSPGTPEHAQRPGNGMLE